MLDRAKNSKEQVETLRRNRLIGARAGETWVVDDKVTRGHKSSILSHNKRDRKKGVVKHASITHAPKTRGMKNIELIENPDKNDTRPSHISAKVLVSQETARAKQKSNFKIKNPIDKSIRRHLKKEAKKGK